MLSPDFCPEAVPQLRVTKGLMSRPYGSVRVSLLSPASSASSVSGFSYAAPFRWAWKQLALASRLVDVTAGQPLDVNFSWMHGADRATVNLPPQGAA